MKLCVALDLSSSSENLALADQLGDLDLWFKVGLRAFIRDGWGFLDELTRIGNNRPIFLDLKLHDIPKTMADAAEAISDRGVSMFNLHASAGPSGLQAVMDRLSSRTVRPLVLGVTALTSLPEHEFASIYHAALAKEVPNMAQRVYETGLDGVVCSVHEVGMIRLSTRDDFLTLTPGIRFAQSAKDDQSRIASPTQARIAGSNFIVMGRPIYGAITPRTVALSVLEEISS